MADENKNSIKHDGIYYVISTQGEAGSKNKAAGYDIEATVCVSENSQLEKEIVEIPHQFDYTEEDVKWICSVIQVNDGAFTGNGCVKIVTIDEGVECLLGRCFSGCSLKQLTLPSTIDIRNKKKELAFLQETCVEAINFKQGKDCEFLRVKDGVLYYQNPKKNDNMALYCIHDDLKDCIIQEDTKAIASYAFYKHSLETLTLPSTLETINANAFVECENLKFIKINSENFIEAVDGALDGIDKNCIIYVSNSKFADDYRNDSNWSRFTKIISEIPKKFDEGNLHYDPVDFDKREACVGRNPNAKGGVVIKSVVEHEGICYNVRSIAARAFESADIETVTLPSSIEEIGDKAFLGCKLLKSFDSEGERFYAPQGVLIDRSTQTLIQYPMCKEEAFYELDANVKTIGSYAFDGCDNLTQITVSQENPPIVLRGGLSGVDKSCIIMVPKGTIGDYKKADGWKEFNILDEEPKSFVEGQLTYKVVNFSEKTVEIIDQNVKGFITVPEVGSTVTHQKLTYTICEVGAVVCLPEFDEFDYNHFHYVVHDPEMKKVVVPKQEFKRTSNDPLALPKVNDKVSYKNFEFVVEKVEEIVVKLEFDKFDDKGLRYEVVDALNLKVRIPKQTINCETNEIQIPKVNSTVTHKKFEFLIENIDTVNILPSFKIFVENGLKYSVMDPVANMKVRLESQLVIEGTKVKKKGDKVSYNGFVFTVEEVGAITKVPQNFPVDGVYYKVHDLEKKYVTLLSQKLVKGTKVPDIDDNVVYQKIHFVVKKIETITWLPDFKDFVDDSGLKYSVMDPVADMKVRLESQLAIEGTKVKKKGEKVSYNGFVFTVKEVGAITKVPQVFPVDGVNYKVHDLENKHVTLLSQKLVKGTKVPAIGEEVVYQKIHFVVKKIETITWLPDFKDFVDDSGLKYSVMDPVADMKVRLESQTVFENISIPSIGAKILHDGFTFTLAQIGNVTRLPSKFSEGNINYKVLSFEDKTVEVTVTPEASGTITIPSRVTTHYGITYDVVGIGKGAFDRKKNITDVSLPDSIKYVGELAFCGVSSKRAITLPKSLESIGRSAFNSKGLTFANLDLPSGLKEIKQWAFASATIATKMVKIPASVCSMEYDMFGGSVESIVVDSKNAKYKSIDGVLFSKNGDTLIEYPGLNARKTYEVPKDVKIIGQQAFPYCENLEMIILPSTVSSISMEAFYSNPSLAVLEVRATTPPKLEGSALGGLGSNCVIIVPKGCFAKYKTAPGWNQLKDRIFEESSFEFPVGKLNYRVLSLAEKTVEVVESPNASGAVVIPAEVPYSSGLTFNVIGIGESAFELANINDISLPDTIKYIGDTAFSLNSNNISLKNAIVLPKSLESVGQSAFSRHFTFVNLDLPSSMKKIDNWAFGCQVSTKKAVIPASVSYIGSAVFRDSNIEKIVVNSANPKYQSSPEGALFTKNKDTLIELPPAFPDTSYEVPKNVKVIGSYAFFNCKKLSEIILPETVNSIGQHAFYGCKSLGILKVDALTPPILEKGALEHFNSSCIVLVPKGRVNTYKAKIGWKEIENQIVDEIHTNFEPVVEIPAEFTTKDKIKYKVLLPEKTSVEVVANPKLSGNVVVPPKVEYEGITFDVIGIGSRAFDTVSDVHVKSVKLPDTIKYIGKVAFQGQPMKISLPSSLEKVESYGFSQMIFDDLTLPPKLKMLDDESFINVVVYTHKVNIPASLEDIDGNPFYMADISEINVDRNNKNFLSKDGVLFSSDMKRIICYPRLKEGEVYTIPEGVETIGAKCFAYSNNLKKVVIPESVKKVGNQAFYIVYNFTTIRLLCDTPPEVKDGFGGGPKNANSGMRANVIIVPSKSAKKYRKDSVWKKFEIQEAK